MNDLLDFVGDLPEEDAQPWQVKRQGDWVAVIQWDGTGEQRHWVLIPIKELDDFIQQVSDAAL